MQKENLFDSLNQKTLQTARQANDIPRKMAMMVLDDGVGDGGVPPNWH